MSGIWVDILLFIVLGIALWGGYLLLRQRKTPKERRMHAEQALVLRADRARRSGRISEALRLYAEGGQQGRLLTTLQQVLPAGPIRAAFVETATAWTELNASITLARSRGVTPVITERLTRETNAAATSLWARVDRVAAAVAMLSPRDKRLQGSAGGGSAPPLVTALNEESDKLRELARAMHDARLALAELTLTEGHGGTELERVERSFRTIVSISQALREHDLV